MEDHKVYINACINKVCACVCVCVCVSVSVSVCVYTCISVCITGSAHVQLRGNYVCLQSTKPGGQPRGLPAACVLTPGKSKSH